MRIVYFLLKFTLGYTLRIFYPRIALNNSPKELLGRTIYVSNHAASFMDPLVVACLRWPIVFFMTRSDVFTKITKPFLWACHMLPIYRQLDGGDTKSKNNEVFKRCTRILKSGRNLLIFGEGFTDDVFIRRLKPIKKGALKIGFGTLESQDWKYNIYIAGVGVNYSNPNQMRSDILISTSDKILLNDYRKEYEENPNKTITSLLRRIEKLMQEQITHIEDKENAAFHEQIMMISRKGMNADNFNRSIPLKKRWRYSQALANWLNEQNSDGNSPLKKLKEQSQEYFYLLNESNVEEQYIHWKMTNGKRMKELMMIILLFPFNVIGLVHCFIPYILTKRFVEKSFKRKVFWGSVKLIVGKLAVAIFNIPTLFLFYYLVYPSWWLSVGYFLGIGIFGLASYVWFLNLKAYKKKGVILKMDVEEVIKKRKELESNMVKVVPVF